MKNIQPINDFLTSGTVAMAGVSRNKKKFGYQTYKKLMDNGFTILPINPNTDMIDNVKCYRDILSLPEGIDSVIIMTSKKETDKIVSDALTKGISNIWIQQHSETKSAVEMANNKGVNIVTGECILMYCNPDGIHKFHRFLKKLFGLYPA